MTSPTSGAIASADDSRALIVTWNPNRGKWRKVGYQQAIDRTARGETVEEDWSTGVRKHGVSRGDQVFMLQQGNQGRGIVASGHALGEIYQIPAFDSQGAPGQPANNLDIAWDHVFTVEDGLPTALLEVEVPAINYGSQTSGILVEGADAALLMQLWRDLLARHGHTVSAPVGATIAAVESVSNPRRQFGKRFSAAENAAIEQRAVQVTRDYFEHELGYETEDVGAFMSYDVRATKGPEVLKIEVKGTTTDGAGVVLTRNEVTLHRAEYPHNALAVVHHVILNRTGDPPTASGGELHLVTGWQIDDADLAPIAYDYRTGLGR